MKLLRITSIVTVLLSLILIGELLQIGSTEETLTEKNRIITNLKNKNTRLEEVTKIKQLRQTQIEALICVITDYQQALKEDRANRTAYPAESAIELLGDIKASEAVDSLIRFACFMIDEETPSLMVLVSTDRTMAFEALDSATQKSLVSIGYPSVPLLIDLLKGENSYSLRSHFSKELGDEIKKRMEKDETHKFLKYQFARKVLYKIENDCAIHRLEKAFNEETDKKKKENLSEAISKFKEELKAGAYNK